jgi:imidazolonepropionase-like amidohydrolase
MRTVLRFPCLILLVWFLSVLSVDAADGIIVLKAARLFDGKAKALVPNGVVIVQGDKITDAGSNLPISSGAQVIDLGDATLSPGFMDAHTHLTFDFSGNFNERRLKALETNVSELTLMTSARNSVIAKFSQSDGRPAFQIFFFPHFRRIG